MISDPDELFEDGDLDGCGVEGEIVRALVDLRRF